MNLTDTYGLLMVVVTFHIPEASGIFTNLYYAVALFYFYVT